jgi:hypothetical protein
MMKPATTIALAVGVTVTFIVCLCVPAMPGKHIARQTKLTECSATNITLSFRSPKGQMLSLVIGIPYPGAWFTNFYQQIPFSFAGRVRFVQGQTTICEFPFDSDNAVRCNWLAREYRTPLPLRGRKSPATEPDLPVGFIISPRLAEGLAKYLRPARTYGVQISFSQMPPVGSSVWYTWSQRYKDFEQQ